MPSRRFVEGTGAIEHQPIDWIDRITGLIVSGLFIVTAGYGMLAMASVALGK